MVSVEDNKKWPKNHENIIEEYELGCCRCEKNIWSGDWNIKDLLVRPQ